MDKKTLAPRLLTLTVALFIGFTSAKAQVCNAANLPFSTSETHLTVWNGEQYVPFFAKGVNVGVAVPGTHPGQLAATRSQYASWLQMIHEAGFNSIRLYTLHYPRFYEVLDSFNHANPNHPLYLMQGVWLSETGDNYQNNLRDFDAKFTNEIEENVDCIHGNRTIAPRVGKAHGTYTADVSEWTMAYIIGREVYAVEVLTTNALHSSDTAFTGNYLNIQGCNPSEYWVVEKLDHLLTYNQNNYSTQRPVSYSNWPTLDPMEHPFEPSYLEDAIDIDLNDINDSGALAGYFASYHVYPYYPDFISDDPTYQQATDAYGPNSYFGYVEHLRSHYTDVPLLIAEFGVPSSWGIAHYASNGMNHGGFSEYEQGQMIMRMLETIDSTNCAGGMAFAWIDEWFKSVWITSEMDYNASKRVRWHDITNPEQNYGLLAFDKKAETTTLADFGAGSPITKINAGTNFDFFNFTMYLDQPLSQLDTIWIGIDTYADTLGEIILPSGDAVYNRCEFALRITNFSAELYVTEAYDLYGIWHGLNIPGQYYQSKATYGGGWNLVRWKNDNEFNAIQYIGNLGHSTTWQPEKSSDAVRIDPDSIRVKLPWTLLQFVNPSQMRVIHDDKNTSTKEEYESEGIRLSIVHNGVQQNTPNRFTWSHWSTPSDYIQRKKDSYYFVQNQLPNINSKAIAMCDEFVMDTSGSFGVVSVLDNDVDTDGNLMQSVITVPCQNGIVHLNYDGTFSYTPIPGFTGVDTFRYSVFDGWSLSKDVAVHLVVPPSRAGQNEVLVETKVFPNPVLNILEIESSEEIEAISLFAIDGSLIEEVVASGKNYQLDLSDLPAAEYLVLISTPLGAEVKQIIKSE